MNTPSTIIMTRGQGLRRSTALWLSWILASSLGYSLSFVLIAGCFFFLFIMLQMGLGHGMSAAGLLAIVLAVLVLTSVIGGLVVGRLQLLVLRRRLDRPRIWLIWTTLAWIFIGLAPIISWYLWDLRLLYLLLLERDMPALLGLSALGTVAIGTVVGICQWMSLRRTVKAAAWWIPISALAWVLAFYTGHFFLSLPPPAPPILMAVGEGIIISMVTGIGLVVLLEPIRQRPVLEAAGTPPTAT